MSNRIMLLEHEAEARTVLAQHLQEAGHEVICPVDSYVGLEIAADTVFDLVLFNNQMPIITGHDFLQALRQIGFIAPAVVFTQSQTIQDTPAFDALSPLLLVQKPFQIEALLSKIVQLTQ